MKILALDASLTATGYALGHSETGVLRPPRYLDGPARLIGIREGVLDLAAGADLVVLEGYSFASRGRAVISLGELGGVLRVAFHEAGLPVVEVAPGTRAKFATGRGNAGKEEVLAAAIRRLGYEGHDNNAADALWLWTMAAIWYGATSVSLPKAQLEALAVIDWPALDVQQLATV